MTFDELDRLIADWRMKLDAAAQGLVDLRSQPAYLQLAARPQLTGVTRTRVEPMLESMVNLFDDYDKLQSLLAKSVEARKEMSRIFISPEKIDAAGKILTQPLSIDLLTKLNTGLTEARELVFKVDGAWRQLGSQLDSVDGQNNALGPRIAFARQRIAQDPLGAQAETDAIVQLAARRSGLRQELKDAAQTLGQIRVANTQAMDAYAEAKNKIQSAGLKQPAAPADLASLDQWLQTLIAKVDEGAWDAVTVGLDHWNQSAARCLQSELDAAQINLKPVLLRRELRGRLDALKAKAAAKGKSEDADLARISKQARTMLQTNPTSIDQAEQAIREYERRLSVLCQ